MFYPNQKVVCIDDSGVALGFLHRGEKYTVVALCPRGSNGIAGLQVAEVIAPVTRIHPKFGWKDTRFRPLTDISISDVLAKTAPKDSHEWDNRRRVKEKVS